MMWKFRDLILRSVINSVDPISGDITTTNVDTPIKGIIVPASTIRAFASKVDGFQQGAYGCYCDISSEPNVNKDKIVDGTDEYLITGSENWNEHGFLLEIKK